MNKQQFLGVIVLLASLAIVGITIAKSLSKPEVKSATIVKMDNISKKITKEEVAKHNSEQSCWVIVDKSVYDVTNFIPQHPGGKDKILPYCGGDATDAFFGKGHSSQAQDLLATFKVGDL